VHPGDSSGAGRSGGDRIHVQIGRVGREMASGGVVLSSSAKTCCFRAISSKTASTTRSACRGCIKANTALDQSNPRVRHCGVDSAALAWLR
jgi:hypothetical protein